MSIYSYRRQRREPDVSFRVIHWKCLRKGEDVRGEFLSNFNAYTL